MTKRDFSVDFTGTPTVTKQEFRDDCDINSIMSRIASTHGIPLDLVPSYLPSGGEYIDCMSRADYQTSLDLVIHAQSSFDSLPSKVRIRFGNSPEKFLEFFNDSSNVKEALDLGLITPDQAAPFIKKPDAKAPSPATDPVDPVAEHS